MEILTTTGPSLINSSTQSSVNDSSVWTPPVICGYIPNTEKNVTEELYPPWKIEKMTYICDEIWKVQIATFFMAQAIGLPGNILAFLTMLQFPKTTATFYLALLAVSDWMALVTKAINSLLFTLETFNDWSCKIMLTLTNFTAIYANWVLVFICFERLVTIVLPLKKSYYFTLRRAYISAALLAIVIFLLNSVWLWVSVAGPYVCNIIDPEFSEKWSYVDTAIYSYLPSILMLIMVVMIWRSLKKIQKNRRLIFCDDDGSGSNALTEQRLREQAKMESSITIMLLFASITFLVLTVPLCVMIIVSNNIESKHPNLNTLYIELAYNISIGFVHMSHAVNFFIYFISTERFRAHLLNLLKCSRLRKKKQLSSNIRTEQTTVVDQL